ncbi:MAG: LacI family transcriptional regulator [Candidatus Kryptonium sp.]|nr:LacI family transcriptional regulator [Candidatus Kryptonium sp.]
MGRVSIRDVAKVAGVSISTVSRVLNGTAPVSDELKKKVMETVEFLDYKPSVLAKGLRKGVTRTIGFIIPDITNPFFSLMVRGAEDYLKRKDYCLIIGSSDQSEIQEKRLLTAFSERVDGIIFTGTGKQNEVLDNIIKKGKKVVFLDRVIKGFNTSYVVSDNYGGMKALVEYLVSKGYKSFFFINGQKETLSAQNRYKAFVDTLKAHGIENYEHVFSSFTYESGYKYAKALSKLPDVVVCGNDLIAYGVISALKEMGLSIPSDVAVTGYDDILFSEHYKPSLTTVRQPIYDMGRKAAEMIIKMINDKTSQPNGVILPNEIVIRESA